MKFISLFAFVALAASTADAFVVQSRSFLKPTARRSTAASTQLRMAVAPDAKVILITGSQRGLGKAIALKLAARGQKLVINYLNESFLDQAKETVAEIKALGADAIHVEGDASNPESVKKMFAETLEQYGRVDVLINNAGITKDGLVLRMKPEQWQAVINVNLSGVFYCSQEFFKIASKQRSGRIINMSSVVGKIGNPGQANYAASKGGVLGLTYSNAKEFASRGVTVNAICPGYIATDMTAKLDKEYLDKVCELIPLGRLGTADEIAGMATFLALDPAADYITGTTFNVDGGIGMGT